MINIYGFSYIKMQIEKYKLIMLIFPIPLFHSFFA